MIKKFYLVSLIFLLQLSFLISKSLPSIKIIASVDDQIITNFDVLKESRYLKVLNPNLKNLDDNKIQSLAKQSIIKETIKKKEIAKFVDLKSENLLIDEYLNNLIVRLGYKNKKEFSSSLLKNETYSLEEIRFKIKIELFWNELIFNRFNNQISIDKGELSKKLDLIENEEKKEFFLSEIVFTRIKDEKINDTIIKIKKSIEEIGFNNTANIYSISDSSKFGGEIGWIKEDSISQNIQKNIINLKPNEYSDVMKLNNNFIILKINDIRVVKNLIDREKELQQLINREKNKKLEKFSIIYFNKVQTQYLIDER